MGDVTGRGYSPGFSASTVAAGGCLKALIPPSIVMILYSIVARTFIFDIFIAAIVPAVLVILLNLLAIAIVVRIYPDSGPAGPRVPWKERWRALWNAAPMLLLIGMVFLGLYSGVFTVNEAAAVAAVFSLLFAVARRKLTWKSFKDGLLDGAAI